MKTPESYLLSNTSPITSLMRYFVQVCNTGEVAVRTWVKPSKTHSLTDAGLGVVGPLGCPVQFPVVEPPGILLL